MRLPILGVIAWMLVHASGLAVDAVAGTSLSNGVTVEIDGHGEQEIGTIKVDEFLRQGAFAEFRLHSEFRWLDACYDFRWVSIMTAYTAEGADQNAHPKVGLLPGIEPRAHNPSDGADSGHDDLPFFWTNSARLQVLPNGRRIYVEGSRSIYIHTPPDDSDTNSIINYSTYLVAVPSGETPMECDLSLEDKDFGVLTGFKWHYLQDPPEASIDSFVSGPQEAFLVNLAVARGVSDTPPHAGNPGFPGWQASSLDDFVLCECTKINDQVSVPTTPPDIVIATIGPAIFVNADGDVIDMTFPDGVTPIAEEPQSDTVIVDETPKAIKWFVSLEDKKSLLRYDLELDLIFMSLAGRAQTEFKTGLDLIMIPQVEPPGFGPIGVSTTLDLDNNTYRVEFEREDGGKPDVYEGALQDYPHSLPPELRSVPLSRWYQIIGSIERIRCLGDLNNDGSVDGADLTILLSQWASVGLGDLNADGTVDGADLTILLSVWGNCACGTATTGSCFVAHDAPFCNDEECCLEVCRSSPECCELGWDSGCASLARFICNAPASAPCEAPSRLMDGKPSTFEFWHEPNDEFQSPELKGCEEPDGPVEGDTLKWNKGSYIETPPCGSGCVPPPCTTGVIDVLEVSGHFSEETEPGTQPRVGILPLTAELAPGSDCDPPGVLQCPSEQLGEHGESFTFRAEFDITNADRYNRFYIGGSELEVITVTWTREYCEPEPGACCVPGSAPGCPSDPKCEQAVCDFDSFCCNTLWDETCAVVAALLCLECEGHLPCDEGACCTEHKNPGCESPACCEQVCSLDPFCCGASWDSLCVFKATAICTECGGGVPCGEGDCCTPNGTAGCEDPLCCALVCQSIPDCCEIAWDESCAKTATSLCPTCSGGG